MNLYHGTTILRHERMKLMGFVQPAPYGDQHVSLTDCPKVASYFALNSYQQDDEDELGMVILETHTGALERHGLSVAPFSSAVWGPGKCDWEREYACADPIPIDLFRVPLIFGPIARPQREA